MLYKKNGKSLKQNKMTLHELLTENGIKLSQRQKKDLGTNVAMSYKTNTGLKPEKVVSKEEDFRNLVNDYPKEWLLDKGVSIILRYMNKQSKKQSKPINH
jgi:hypothetical protein